MKNLTFNKSEDLYNMILNCLIALSIAKLCGKVKDKSSSKAIFIGKWLKVAKKQKRYSKSIASDIDNLLRLYAIEGLNSSLSAIFYQLYGEYQINKNTPCTSKVSPKERFDDAMRLLANKGWNISIPLTAEQMAVYPYRPSSDKEIYTTKHYWKGAFDEQKRLTKPVNLFVFSSPQAFIDCLFDNGFILTRGVFSKDEKGNSYYQFILFPENNYIGTPAIPTLYLE